MYFSNIFFFSFFFTDLAAYSASELKEMMKQKINGGA